MMDVATHALACDVTRVMTLQLSYAFSNVTHTWLGHTSAHHTMSHDGAGSAHRAPGHRQLVREAGRLPAGKLDAVNEGNGTLLDNTLVVWGRELGSTAHRMERVPFMLAGKAGGALRTGRFLNYDKQEHAKLLVSVAQLMGLSTVNTVGNRQTSAGPLAGLL